MRRVIDERRLAVTADGNAFFLEDLPRLLIIAGNDDMNAAFQALFILTTQKIHDINTPVTGKKTAIRR